MPSGPVIQRRAGKTGRLKISSRPLAENGFTDCSAVLGGQSPTHTWVKLIKIKKKLKPGRGLRAVAGFGASAPIVGLGRRSPWTENDL